MNIAKRALTVFLTAVLLISLWGAFPLPEAKAQAAQPFTVVLNPGHGPASSGSGAVAGGIKESLLNEQLTASVVAALKSKGINVIVTNKMTSVGNSAPYLLDERPQGTTGAGNSGSSNGQYHFSNQLLPVIHNPSLRLAGMSTPNLLITIHHNATQSSSVNGYELYYSSALGSHLVPNYNKTSDTIARSIDFANLVNSQFAQPGFYLANRGIIDRENNSLTKYSAVPSILVEAGYMTNASDLAAMRNPANQNILADRLANAVVQYAQKYGNSYPSGTTPVVPGPQVPIKATSVKISKNTDGISLTGVANGVTGGTGGIQEVNFAVWPTNQQNRLKWYKGSTKDGKNFSVNVNIGDFSNISGNYTVHVYAKDNAGNDKIIGGGNVELGTKAKAGSVKVSKNADGASLTAAANNVTPGNAGIKEVKFAVWPTNKQSQLKWYNGNTTDKKNFIVNAATRDFSNTGGNYTVHIYAFDNADNATFIGAGKVDLASTPIVVKPKATSVKISKNADGVSLTGVASGVTGGNGGIKEVNFAVWPTNQQNLIKWYKGSTKDGKNFNVKANISDFNNIIGNYTVHVYARDYASSDSIIGAGNVELGVKPKATSVKVSKNADGASLTAVANNVTGGTFGIKEVKFAVWPTNRQNIMKWYTGNTADKKNFNVNVATRDFNNTGGNYTVHIYAWDKAGTPTFIGAGKVDLASTPIVVKPKATSVKISKNADGVSLTGVASGVTGGNGGIKEVNFAVWPTNQQNLIKWYKGSTKDGKNFNVKANISDFNNIIGNYTVHVYARDYASSDSIIGAGNVELGVKPKATSVKVSKNADGASLTAVANNVTGGSFGIKEVKFAVWPSNKQNLLKWYKGTTTDGKTFKTSVNIKDYSNLKCEYTVHTYAWDKAGTPTLIGAGKVNMGVTITPAKGGATKINVNPANQNEATFMVSNVTGGTGGIKQVSFAIWPTSDFGKLKWYTATRSGSNWFVNANISQFGNIYGNYTAHVYAKDNNGDQYFIGAATANLGGKVNTVTTDKSVYDSPNMTCYIRPGFAVKSASVAVWSSYGGQDDIQWIQTNYDAQTHQWIANVDLTKFTSAGTFEIHAYGVNSAGKNTFINATTATVKAGAFNGYRIMGASSVTEQQLANYIMSKGWDNAWYGGLTANQFAKKYIDICAAEGVKAEVAFAQMCLETNNLKFTGDVRREQFNFAGLGATGGGVPGIAFRSIDDGIKSQVQHLKRYSSTDSFKLPTAPEYTRYKLVQAGCAPTVEMLGGKWATGSDYGAKILNMIDQILKTSSVASRMMAVPRVRSVNLMAEMAVEPVETVEVTEEALPEETQPAAEDEASPEETKPITEDENQDAVLKEEVEEPAAETELTPLEPTQETGAPTEDDNTIGGSPDDGGDDSAQQNPSDTGTTHPTDGDNAEAAPENTSDADPAVNPKTDITLEYLNPLNNQLEEIKLDVSEDEPKTDKDAIYAAIAKFIKSDLFKTEVVKVEECAIDGPTIVDEGIKIKVHLSKPLEIPATLSPELVSDYEKAALTSIADMYLYYIDNVKQVEFLIEDASYTSSNLTLGAEDVFKELLPNINRAQ